MNNLGTKYNAFAPCAAFSAWIMCCLTSKMETDRQYMHLHYRLLDYLFRSLNAALDIFW